MATPEAVVVFGAGGFIGRNIVNELHSQGVFVAGVTGSGAAVPGCAVVVPASGLDQLPALPKTTAIINVAAFRYAPATFRQDQARILSTNLAITEAVYRLALERGITEIRAASSSAIYPASWPVLDDAIPLDLNGWPHDGEAPYAWSKRWAEITAELWYRNAGIATISFRLTNPYGPFDTLDEDAAHVATAFAIRALSDEPDFEIRGNPNAERDFVFSGDIAATFVRSLTLTGVHDAVNLAAGSTCTVSDLAICAMQAAGRERKLRTAQTPAAGVAVRRATATRLRQLLPDLPPFRPLADGMRATVDWYRHELR
jgi:nucleoside-diphosphate-sugar epimerase